MSSSFKIFCRASLDGCEQYVNPAREKLGYMTCIKCGDKLAKDKSKLYTIVPMHKSNYVAVFNREDLVGINSKGGLVK